MEFQFELFTLTLRKKKRKKTSFDDALDLDSNSSTISTDSMKRLVDKLRYNHNRSSTRNNYLCVWRSFNEFFIHLDVKPDSWEDRLVLFIAYLIEQKKKSSTIRSYISAIKSVLVDDSISLNQDKYLITSLTKACKYQNDTVHTRLPI